MNRKTFRINRTISIMLLATIFIFAFVWTRSSASEPINNGAHAQKTTPAKANITDDGAQNAESIISAPMQGRDSLRRFGALKVSAGNSEQSSAANTGNPRAALSADFDSDGIQDLLVAHNDRLVFHRGNINAFAPQTEAAWEAIRDRRFVSPFESKTRSTALPTAAPDFLISGDFNRDTFPDAAVASRNDAILYVLLGDGRGDFSNLLRIETNGAITALASGDVNLADGLPDIIIGTSGADGFGLQIFSGLGDIFAAGSLVYNLPSRAEAITIGQLDENEFNDVAVAAGNEIIILSGINATKPEALKTPAEMQRIGQPGNIKSITAGDFLPDRDNRTELALLMENGALRVLKRGVLDMTPVTKREHRAEQVREYLTKGYPIPERILQQLTEKDLQEPAPRQVRPARGWSEAESEMAAMPDLTASPQAILSKGRMSRNAAEDLMVLDSSSRKVLVFPFIVEETDARNQTGFRGKRETVEFLVEDNPVAVLPMRLNADGETDLLVIGRDQTEFAAMVTAPQAAFVVNSNADLPDSNLNAPACQASNGLCTLRAAIMQANKTAGNDSITINSGIGDITINRGQPDDDAGGTNDEANGDLDITCVIDPSTFGCAQPYTSNDNDLTITGAAGGSVVQAGTFTSGLNGMNTDRVFDIGQDGIFGGAFGGSTGIIVSMSNLTIRNGNIRQQAVVAGGGNFFSFGGGIRYDGFGVSATHGSLTLNTVTVHNNQSDNAGGGVYQVFGTFNATGSTFSNNITKAGEGGGFFFGAATSNSNVNISSSSFSTNEARQGNIGNTFTANADGGGLRINADPNTVTINTTNFTGNIAQQDGGAIKTLAAAVTVTGGTMTGNIARRHGGVAFGDQDVANTGRTFTFSGVTMQNNTANSDGVVGANDEGDAGDGGAIFRDRGVLNITNSTIGGTGALQPNMGTNGGGVAHAFTVDSAAGNTSNQTTININGGSINGNVANADGGGVYFNAATFDVTASILNIGASSATAMDSNKAKNNGGGLFVSDAATATLTNMVLRSNQANSDLTGGGDGGAFYQNIGTTTFAGTTMTVGGSGFANTAVNGGGIRNNAGTVNITATNDSITHNTATGNGGGISNAGTLGALATPTITNNTASGAGGGLHNTGTVGTLTTPTITNNTATGNGGGIFNSGTLGVIASPALNLNSGATGGGIFSSSGALTINGGTVNSNTASSGKGGGVEHGGTSASAITGASILNNTGSGVHITGTGSLDVKTSTITGNSGDGITKIGTGVGSHFDSNIIHTNGELGIDLSDNAVTPNDTNDADTGPNNLQNFPVINWVRRGDGIGNVTLNAPNGKYRIQYYKNATCDGSGHGEGEILMTSQVVDIISVATQTLTTPALAYDAGVREQITAIATHDANGNNNFDDDGSTSEFSACRKVNTLPTFPSVQTPSRQQGSPVSNSQIATVTDPDQTLNTLAVTVKGVGEAGAGGASKTVNGVTVSGIAVDASGNVTANIIADCTATNASFTLRVTDTPGEFNETNLNVTVTANTNPTVGNYPNTTVNAGSSGTVITPDAAPADNGTISSVTAVATSPAGFTGTFVGNTMTGAITVNNANVFGVYTITVTVTDNCGSTVQKTFTLTVNAIPTVSAQAGLSRQQGSPATNSQIATVNDNDQTEETLVVSIRAVGGAAPGTGTATVNGVTVSNITVSAAGVVNADIVASCMATNASFTLRVTDANNAFSETTLAVSVTPNTPPSVGTYPATIVAPGAGTTVTPSAAPTDNGSITTATASATGFGGTLTVDTTTGVVTVNGANPVGTYTVNVVFTENCGATTSVPFTLRVTNPPTITAATDVRRSQGSLTSNSQIATVNDIDQTENTLVVTVNSGASATVNGVTVSGIAVDASGNVTANVVANGTATTATFTLRVTDAQGAFSEATLTVTVVVGGFEADVAPRPNGDGNGRVNAGDVTQVQRFAAGLDRPFQSNELQRADSAPRLAPDNVTPQHGNGLVNAGDVTQAQRYAANLDGGTVAAAGPTAPPPPPPPAPVNGEAVEIANNDVSSEAPQTAGYTIFATRQNITGTTLTVAVSLSSDASKTGVNSFSGTLRFTQSVIGNPTNIRLGAGAPAGSSVFPNTTDILNGRLGLVFNAPVNQSVAPGNQALVLIDFTIANGAPNSTTLTFDDSQSQRFIGDVLGNELTPSTFASNTISLIPTAGQISIGGRVVTADNRPLARAVVSITDAGGATLSATSNSFGFFRFSNLRNGDYVIEVRHKSHSFEPTVINGQNSVEDLILRAQP